jgi:YD repeat-containing protein
LPIIPSTKSTTSCLGTINQLIDGHCRTVTGDTAVWRTYAYDARRKLEDLNDLVNAAENRDFTYDGNGRLVTASGPWGTGAFSYDAEGNLRAQTLGPRAITVAYDGTNRVTSANDNGTAKAYAYDDRGNAVTAGANSFVYDLANQPVSVSGGAGGSYEYDANFKRVKSVVNGAAIYSAYSKVTGNIIFRYDVTGGVITEYASAGAASVRIKNGVVEYTHADHLGGPYCYPSVTRRKNR